MEVMALLWGCGKSFSCFLNFMWCLLLDWFYLFTWRETKPMSAVKAMWCSFDLLPADGDAPLSVFCQSCYQQKALVSAWRSSRFSAFLIKYVTMIAPAPEEPWKLFLIKLFGFRGADSGFIRPEVYTIWKSSLRKIVIQNCGYKIECRALEGVPTNKNH